METFFQDVLAQLTEYYDWLVRFFPSLVLAVAVFIIFYLLSGWVRRFSKKRLFHRMDDPLLANFLSRVLKFSINTIGFLLILRIIGLGTAAASVLAGAGVSAFIIGFAFKDIGENFLAGIIMAFKRPFRVGDVVETGDISGTIVALSMRDTQVKTFDGKDVFIPNGMILKNPIINYTIDGFLRNHFQVGLDYDDDLKKAIQIIMGELKEVKGILQETKPPMVVIDEPATSTVNLGIYYWINTFDKSISGLQVKTEAIERSIKALSANGFYMPADIIELKNFNKDFLRMGS